MTVAISNADYQHSEHLFLGKFPSEIAFRIFSFLGPSDCLTSMAVCRSWYTNVPQYSRNIWTKLRLMDGGIHVKNHCWDRCVGEHVTDVFFEDFFNEENLYYAMQRLIDTGCSQVNTLVFESCNMPNQDRFLLLLKQLGSMTTNIVFCMSPYPALSIIHVLHTCPKLVKLSFDRGDWDNMMLTEDVKATALVPEQCVFANLIHLAIDTELFVHELTAILQKCPNLRYLHYMVSYYSFTNSPMLDLDQVLSWCPKLVYLDASADDTVKYPMLPPKLSVNDPSGLRYFMASEVTRVSPQKIGANLMRHAETLEYIGLSVPAELDGLDWSSLFKRLAFPRLRTMALDRIKFDSDALDILFRRCPVLKNLEIDGQIIKSR